MPETRTRIKICGITNREDAVGAIEMGADALGFIFVPESPRYVGNLPGMAELLASLPPFVTRVGVCLHPEQIAPEYHPHLDLLQIYDHSSIDIPGQDATASSHIPAFRIRNESDLEQIGVLLHRWTPRALLLDAYHEQQLGGAGVRFDWNLASLAMERFKARVILAGGLNELNVSEAILQVRPYAVDIASGIEASPGRKDHYRMRAFVNAVYSADQLALAASL